MVETTLIQRGKKMADFTLKNQHGKDFSLSAQAGRKVLLSFHPLAWTDICATQMKLLEEYRTKFDDLRTTAVGISVDSVPCKSAWAGTLGIEHTGLLADFWPHGKVAKSFGMLREKEGFSERANIVIDEQGKVAFVKVYPIPQVPDFDEILEELKKLG